MFAYYLSALGDNAKRFGYLLPETAMTELTIVFVVSSVQAAEYGAANLILLASVWALAEDDRTRANEGMLAPLPCEMRASIL